MKGKIIILYIFLFNLICHCAVAQDVNLKFDLVKSPNGKSLGKINAIAQDPYGYMWFASQGEKCIYRYDGNRFTTFRYDADNLNSLSVVTIETMYADAKG